MKYRFTQQVKILRTLFKVGIREVPEEIEAHPHFSNYVKAGWVHEATEAEVKASTTPATVSERTKKLQARIHAMRTPAFQSEPEKPVEPPPKVEGAWEPQSAEQVHEGVQPCAAIPADVSDAEAAAVVEAVTEEAKLTPAQKAAATRKANAEKAKSTEPVHEGVQEKEPVKG